MVLKKLPWKINVRYSEKAKKFEKKSSNLIWSEKDKICEHISRMPPSCQIRSNSCGLLRISELNQSCNAKKKVLVRQMFVVFLENVK